MEAISLEKLYRTVNEKVQTIFVVPLIRYSHKKSDYLYLLYEDLIQHSDIEVRSISIYAHYKLVMAAVRNRNAILHYHWLEFQDLRSLLGMPFKMFCIGMFKLLGGDIVWTIHNQYPHDKRFLKLHKYLHRKLAQWSSLLHVHCKEAIPIMSEHLQIKKDKFRVISHPEYPATWMDRDVARTKLSEQYECNIPTDIPCALMFGNISYYKQLSEVANIFLNCNIHCRLLIAGPVKKGNLKLFNELKVLSEQNEQIQLLPHFIPEDEVGMFYSAADFCVFNYREILSSGGYHMAQAYNKPIIAPNMGCLAGEGNQPNVQLFDTQGELEALLKQQLREFS